jgi:hypothetical protein
MLHAVIGLYFDVKSKISPAVLLENYFFLSHCRRIFVIVHHRIYRYTGVSTGKLSKISSLTAIASDLLGLIYLFICFGDWK